MFCHPTNVLDAVSIFAQMASVAANDGENAIVPEIVTVLPEVDTDTLEAAMLH